MADKFDGSPWLASAAYNAGEAPVGRWLDARSSLDPDFFIETIPYKETREYVGRVLAFSVIYDWRMHGKALALSARMPKIGQAYAAPNDTTPRKGVACATEPAPATPAATTAPARAETASTPEPAPAATPAPASTGDRPRTRLESPAPPEPFDEAPTYRDPRRHRLRRQPSRAASARG